MDILGNEDVLGDVLKIAAGAHASLPNRLVSNIDQIVARMQSASEGAIP